MEIPVLLIILGLVFMAVGSFGIVAAVLLEMRREKRTYEIMMKLFPWVFGVGCILFSLGITYLR